MSDSVDVQIAMEEPDGTIRLNIFLTVVEHILKCFLFTQDYFSNARISKLADKRRLF